MLKIRFLAFLILFAAVGCTSDESNEPLRNSRLLINFDPRMGDVSVQLGEVISTPLDQSISVSDINFYLSNIELTKANGEVITLAEIVYLNMRQNWRVLEYSIPAGDYRAVSFNLGVPAELNGTENPNFTTSLFDSTHPLSESNGMYWTWESGYRFFFFEGRCDTISPSIAPLPYTFALHSGRDTLFRELPVFEKNFSAEGDHTNTLNFAIDLDRIFSNEGQTIDLNTERTFHGAYAQLPLGIKLADNTAASFRLIN